MLFLLAVMYKKTYNLSCDAPKSVVEQNTYVPTYVMLVNLFLNKIHTYLSCDAPKSVVDFYMFLLGKY